MHSESASPVAGCLLTLLVLLVGPSSGDVGRIGGWELPQVLAQSDSEMYMPLANCWAIAAVDDTLHVVWYDKRSGGFEICYLRSTDRGTSWLPETRLTDDTVYSGYPAIATSGSSVYVVWVQGRDPVGESLNQICYRRSTNGGASWEPAAQLSHSSGLYGGWFPCVAASGPNVHVGWEDDRGGDDVVYYRRSTDNGASWFAEYPIVGDPGMVNVTLAVSGNIVHAAYSDFWNEVVFYQRSTDNGINWSPKRGVPTPDASDCPCLAVSGSTVHMVYCDGRNGFWDVWYCRSTDNGLTWSADICIMPDIYQSWSANVAASGQNVHVLRGDMGMYQVHYIRSTDAGLTWGPERCLSESVPGGDAMHYSVAVTDSTVHVVWDKERVIYYRRNQGGNPVGIQEWPDTTTGSGSPPTHFANRLRVAGHESDRFEVFDFTGRRVGVLTGAGFGQGLPAGGYFVRPVRTRAGWLKVVKVR